MSNLQKKIENTIKSNSVRFLGGHEDSRLVYPNDIAKLIVEKLRIDLKLVEELAYDCSIIANDDLIYKDKFLRVISSKVKEIITMAGEYEKEN